MNLQEMMPETLKMINNTPFLLSILYDVNLLPEQVTTYQQANVMSAIVEAYLAGRSDGVLDSH